MVNYYIYARDCSFSTFNNEHYHSNGLKTLEQFKRDVENVKKEEAAAGLPPTESRIIYLHWGDDCWEVDEDETKSAYLAQHCEHMGSEPEWIVRYLQKCITNENDRIKLLYIVTDGLINKESVKKCFRWNNFMHYETFVFHAFNEDLEKIDLSVAASFFKSRCLVYRNYKLYASTDISKEFHYDKIDVSNFAAKRDELRVYITLKFIDEFNQEEVALEEIDKLKSLRDRLFGELSLGKVEFGEREWNNDLVRAMEADIEKSISALINYIGSDEKSYSFDVLMFEQSVEEEEDDDSDVSSDEEYEIFDFTLEEDLGIPCGNMRLVDVT